MSESVDARVRAGLVDHDYLFEVRIHVPIEGGALARIASGPGVIVRIPAIPWLMPEVIGAMVLKRSEDGLGQEMEVATKP